jgi:DNA-binding transcriptional LysR family regulator
MFEDMIIPVCGTSLADQGRLPKSTADLARHTLLRMDETVERRLPWLSWDHWLEQTGAGDVSPRATLRFSNFDQVIQAALSGQGMALARAPLVVELLLQKRLLTPLGSIKIPGRGYYLLTSRSSMQREDVRDFVRWIGEEAAQTRELLKRAMLGIKKSPVK